MRLFIAIEFQDNIKEHLYEEIKLLKSQSESGNFTLLDNLHLTLEFLGETNISRINDIKKAMQEACKNFEKSNITINGFGKFVNRGELLYWRGLECSQQVITMQQNLRNELKNSGFKVDSRAFKPHITMGRKCIMKDSFNEENFERALKKVMFDVSVISLMKSERINNRMVYTNICKV